MKIAIYKDTFANNRGADVAVKNLAAGLEERGHAVTLFDKTEFSSKVRGDYDVIVSTGTNEILDLAQVEGLPPIVQQFHTAPASQFKWKRFLRNRRIRMALKKVAAIQVLREEYRAEVSRYGAPVSVIGNWSAYGVSAEAPDVKERKMVLYPAAFSKSKNHGLLLKSFSLLHDEFPDWTLELYGNGKVPEVLPPNVKVMQFGDLRNAYGACAFVAFPSADEGFGLVIAEAASFGKCSVAVCDWIGTGAAGGAVVTAPTVSGYADGLRQLMRDEEARLRMGRAAQKYCADNFSRGKIMEKWEQLLLSAVARG